jgi:hypothetical protein
VVLMKQVLGFRYDFVEQLEASLGTSLASAC